jgi:O-antigen/teichoic acid export membrane protein
MWYGIETGFSILAALATSVLTVRTFGPEKLSYFIYLSWLTGVTGTLGTLGLAITTRKYMAEALGAGDKTLAISIFRTALRWQAVTIGLIVTGGVAVSLVWVRDDYRAIAVVLMLSAFPRVLGFIPAQANMAAENMAANVPGSMVGGLIQVGGTLAALALDWGLIGIAAAQLVGYSVELVWKMWPLWTESSAITLAPLSPDLRRRMRIFSTQGMSLVLLNLIVWDRSDVVLLKWLNADPRQVTFFSLPINLIDRMLLVPQTFASAMGSTVMAEYGRARERVAAMTATSGVYLLALALPMLLGAAAVATPIWAVYGSSVREAIPVFAVMCALAVPKAVMVPAQNLLQVTENQARLVWWNCACGVLKIVLDILLIPHWGAMGAAIGSGAAQALSGVGTWVMVWLLFRLDLRLGTVWRLAMSAATMSGAVWAIVELLAARPWAGFLLGVPAGAAVFVVLVRVTGALEPDDRQRLLLVAGSLPGPVRRVYLRLLEMAIPAIPAAA